MPAQLGHALVYGPDLAAADDGGLPGGVLDLEFEQDGHQVRVGRHAGFNAHHKVVFGQLGYTPPPSDAC